MLSVNLELIPNVVAFSFRGKGIMRSVRALEKVMQDGGNALKDDRDRVSRALFIASIGNYGGEL